MPQSDMSGNNDIQSKLQANSSLSGVTATTNDKGAIELSGTVSSAQDKKEAVRIAKENANGKKVKDHIKVSASANGNSSTSH
jgi:osmotically-inducible protein OsmY